MSDQIQRRWRLPVVGAAIALVLTACGDGGATSTSSLTPPPTTAVTTTITATDSTAPFDPLLTAAIDAVGTRYAFTATVTVGVVESARVDGTVYDGVGKYQVTSGASRVDYVLAPEGQWAREEGADWAVLGGPAPVLDPLTPLTQPLSTAITSSDGDDATIVAVYSGMSLGFTDDTEVLVTLTVTNGALSETRYQATVGNNVATVITTFDPDAEVAPIAIPPA